MGHLEHLILYHVNRTEEIFSAVLMSFLHLNIETEMLVYRNTNMVYTLTFYVLWQRDLHYNSDLHYQVIYQHVEKQRGAGRCHLRMNNRFFSCWADGVRTKSIALRDKPSVCGSGLYCGFMLHIVHCFLSLCLSAVHAGVSILVLYPGDELLCLSSL